MLEFAWLITDLSGDLTPRLFSACQKSFSFSPFKKQNSELAGVI
jgi:hypothetical protein